MRIDFRYLPLLAAMLAGCAADGDVTDPTGVVFTEPDDEEAVVGELEQPFTSDVATLMDFVFSGELTSTSGYNIKGQTRAQLMYTVGHLNGGSSVARLDKLVLSNTSSVYIGSGLYRIRYTAKLPVAWGSKTNLPTSYTFKLPKRVDSTGQSSFTARYGSTCNDGDDASVTVNNFWYHYRPTPSDCSLAPGDIFVTTATVSVNPGNTVAKYPEYHKLWEDGALNVVAVFGKYEVGGGAGDAGVDAHQKFLAAVRAAYPGAYEYQPSANEISFYMYRSGGTVHINVFLVESVGSVTAAWDKRYAELSPGADIIIYSGHAGLGANVAALSRKGTFFPGKYQIFFMNGCDTFAYYDNTLPSLRAVVNPDDPSGTRYMDFITNAMPAYFIAMATDTIALINAAVNHTAPTTYQNIFKNMDRVQVVVVTGEEDNVFHASYDPGVTWNGVNEYGSVAKGQTETYQTEVLQPGTYVFATTPDNDIAGGDADLRVRVGAPPTITSTYKCASYKYNSNERCKLTITTPSVVHIAVTGDKDGVDSAYYLRAYQLKN